MRRAWTAWAANTAPVPTATARRSLRRNRLLMVGMLASVRRPGAGRGGAPAAGPCHDPREDGHGKSCNPPGSTRTARREWKGRRPTPTARRGSTHSCKPSPRPANGRHVADRLRKSERASSVATLFCRVTCGRYFCRSWGGKPRRPAGREFVPQADEVRGVHLGGHTSAERADAGKEQREGRCGRTEASEGGRNLLFLLAGQGVEQGDVGRDDVPVRRGSVPCGGHLVRRTRLRRGGASGSARRMTSTGMPNGCEPR